MRPRLLQALLATGALAATALVIWPGCAIVPLPQSRKPLPGRNPADVQYVRESMPTRTEVLARLGAPDAELTGSSVACYRLNEVRRRRLWLLFGVLPISAPADPVRTDLALLQFGSDDRVQRFGILTNQYTGGNLQWLAKRWATNTATGAPR